MQHDRYVSFCGLECETRAQQLVLRICALSQTRETDNRFWIQFGAKVNSPNGPDNLFLVHSYIFYMRELLEKYQDIKGLQLLDAIEYDCC